MGMVCAVVHGAVEYRLRIRRGSSSRHLNFVQCSAWGLLLNVTATLAVQSEHCHHLFNVLALHIQRYSVYSMDHIYVMWWITIALNNVCLNLTVIRYHARN